MKEGTEQRQECIPVGYIPTAAVAATRCQYRGVGQIPLDAAPVPLYADLPQMQTPPPDADPFP